jgi:2-polyprenyl-3-methyl-5-hydroxy-6-metoxy-1,4-benzoquinol methylase
MQKTCPLCGEKSTHYIVSENKDYNICDNCNSIFLNSAHFLNQEEEKKRYLSHNNDVLDENYRKFVYPITSNILKDFNENSRGLDFGAGTGPVITKILNEQNFNITVYDPYFHNNTEVLRLKYNYIACCEVIEHFYNPAKEFQLLRSMLKDNGKLYCMTEIYNKKIDFLKWYYKNDPTHVFFYTKDTFEYIREKFKFSNVNIKDRLIILSS